MNKEIKILLSAVFLLAMVFIISCKKTADTDPVIDQGCKAVKIEAFTETTLDNTYNLTYDANNRVIQRAGTTNTFNITYDTDKVTVKGTNGGNLEVTLSAGKAVKVASTGTSNYEAYTYTNGYITTVEYYEAGALKSTYTLAYSGGNLVGITRKDVGFSADQTDVTTITYSSTLTNPNLQFIEPFNTMVSKFDAPYRIYGSMSVGIATKVVNTQSTKSGTVVNQTITTNDYTFNKDLISNNSTGQDFTSNYTSILNKKNVKTLADATTLTDVTTNLKYNLAYTCR
ncbi:hypothetical protein [Pedobacter nototheniae]|uniref:hypothetical protein n=1 Tax=Pedobacter nototheniae TaxID=2488994 RepID=UPI00292F6852|nr:hypothetical protein [Pedobacter nototheniae]